MLQDHQSSSAQAAPGGLFPNTRWTVVRQLSNGQQAIRFPAWEQFVESYRRPLECWLLGQCRDPHLAEELVQSFLAKTAHKENALEALDPAKGRLRSWLLVCLKRHWLDHLPRKDDPLPDDYAEVGKEPDREFDGAWARSLAGRVVDDLRADYRVRQKGPLFDALLGVIDGGAIEERAALHERFGMTANTFDRALSRLRERFGLRLRLEVAATLVEGHEAEVDEELRYLLRVLARDGGLIPKQGPAEK